MKVSKGGVKFIIVAVLGILPVLSLAQTGWKSGKLIQFPGPDSAFNDITVTEKGDVVATGIRTGSDGGVLVACFRPDGELKPDFADQGVLIIDGKTSSTEGKKIATQHGHIAVAVDEKGAAVGNDVLLPWYKISKNGTHVRYFVYNTGKTTYRPTVAKDIFFDAYQRVCLYGRYIPRGYYDSEFMESYRSPLVIRYINTSLDTSFSRDGAFGSSGEMFSAGGMYGPFLFEDPNTGNESSLVMSITAAMTLLPIWAENASFETPKFAEDDIKVETSRPIFHTFHQVPKQKLVIVGHSRDEKIFVLKYNLQTRQLDPKFAQRLLSSEDGVVIDSAVSPMGRTWVLAKEGTAYKVVTFSNAGVLQPRKFKVNFAATSIACGLNGATYVAGMAQDKGCILKLTDSSVSNSDADLDGIDDEWERRYFKSTKENPHDDFDQDKRDNLTEYITGSNPTDSHDFTSFSVKSLVTQDQRTRVIYVNRRRQSELYEVPMYHDYITWDAEPNRVYDIYYSKDLTLPFEQIGTVSAPLNNYTNTLGETIEGKGFYRMDIYKKP